MQAHPYLICLAILAFDLKLNGVDLQGKKVDPTAAPTIKLPGR